LARTPIHGDETSEHAGWPGFFAGVYQWVIGMTIGLMVLHNGLHWFRHVRLRASGRQVVRLTANEVAQHWVLMVSFIVLVVSGFSLRFSEAWGVRWLFGWGGGEGFVIRGTVHRVAGAVFLGWMAWHVVYLKTRGGRGWLRDILVCRRDLSDFVQHVLFFVGRRSEPPKFGRFSYMEKCEYWALVWGAVIMAATGVMLWFDNWFTGSVGVPKVVLDVGHVIHYYEAWLATLAIVVWHVYATVFSPPVYPMNPSWWAGRMPEEMYREEHRESADASRE